MAAYDQPIPVTCPACPKPDDAMDLEAAMDAATTIEERMQALGSFLTAEHTSAPG